MEDIEVLKLAEEAIGANLQWISDLADLHIRQKDKEALERLATLSEAWKAIVKHLKERSK